MSDLTVRAVTSDRDFLKIFDDGQRLVSTTGGGDPDAAFPADPHGGGFSGSVTITHNLGSVPLVRGFWDPNKNGTWQNSIGSYTSLTNDVRLKTIATTTTLKLIIEADGGAQTNIPVFYRIYEVSDEVYSSDDRIDKIFLQDSTTGSVSAAPDSLTPTHTILTIPHGYSAEVPIWTLSFSEDNSTFYPEGTKIVGAFDTTSGPPGGPYAQYYYTKAFGYMDATNFYIYLESNYATSKTIYVNYALDTRS